MGCCARYYFIYVSLNLLRSHCPSFRVARFDKELHKIRNAYYLGSFFKCIKNISNLGHNFPYPPNRLINLTTILTINKR